MGEFHLWEFFDMFVKFQEIVDNYLFPNIFILHSMNPYQKPIFMQTKIPDQKSVLYAPLFARQLLDDVVSLFNAREGLT